MHKKFVWIMGIVLIIIIALYMVAFFQPVFLRKNYIGKIIELDIPKSSRILEYRFKLNSFGIYPFYAKLELEEESYETWRDNYDFYEINEIENMIEGVKRDFKYESLIFDDVEQVLFKEKFTSNNSFFMAASTRWAVSFITKESSGKYYLYVLYD